MRPPSEKQATAEITDLLTGLFGNSPQPPKAQHVGATKRFDFAISAAGHRFLAEYKSNASAGSVAAAIASLQSLADSIQDASLLLVIVPFMGEVGRQLCERSQMSWLDLCGNAKIVAPGLNIRIVGRPNKYIPRGRPSSVFAPKSSRIARQLLLAPELFQTQAELARTTDMADGYVSKIVRRLEREQYLDVNDQGAVRPRDPNLLLDAWREAYDFNRQRILKGHVLARTGDELLQRVAQAIRHNKLESAATGLSAAWLYTRFAGYRLVTVYLEAMPPRSLLKQIEFTDEPKGANLWLVVPDDEGVFHGSQELDGIRCVSPLQTYLDLKGQAERAPDAATELRSQFLNWE